MATLSQALKREGAETIIGPSRTDDGIVQSTNSKEATKVEVLRNQWVPGSIPGAGAKFNLFYYKNGFEIY